MLIISICIFLKKKNYFGKNLQEFGIFLELIKNCKFTWSVVLFELYIVYSRNMIIFIEWSAQRVDENHHYFNHASHRFKDIYVDFVDTVLDVHLAPETRKYMFRQHHSFIVLSDDINSISLRSECSKKWILRCSWIRSSTCMCI